MTKKILALTDALGNLVRFRLMPGQCFDSVDVPPLIKDLEFDASSPTRRSTATPSLPN